MTLRRLGLITLLIVVALVAIARLPYARRILREVYNPPPPPHALQDAADAAAAAAAGVKARLPPESPAAPKGQPPTAPDSR